MNSAIDARELKAAMRALGFDVKKEDVRKMLQEIGKDSTAPVTYENFVDIMSGRMADKYSRGEIMKVFRLFDDDDSGKISFRNLKRVTTELGENLTDDDLKEMIEEADRDGDGLINPDEFYRIMRRRGDDPLEDFDSDDD
eukprot:GHVR01019022.1.p1 GENE.GHVR01019022.1~~GHVR01019022.1.p1  ORF type:complete len:140 (+),score=42.20 GHVR01019022.1:209-628(+)